MVIAPHLDLFVSRLAALLPADFAQAVARLDLSAPRPQPQPDSLPVCRFWERVVAGGGALLAPLAKLAPALSWVQNPNYVAAPPSPEFLENYGYAVLAGPGGLVASEALALGILLLGPGIHYPSHNHPAVEIYVVLAGEAEWQKAGEPWRREPPGAVIRHDSMVTHATRALAEPLLAAYVWQGDLATHARIIASPMKSGS
ncbi:MAG TPA: dimethylsulfonioproprionate lyase family protein [Dongiaceae bacterium]|nr:dimethylsulfonioproprionate lyase family protein [Dongiaceae bacterium]